MKRSNMALGSTLTKEQRIANLNKARQVVAERRATLRMDYADMGEWEQLAKDAALRLPRNGSPVTTAAMKRWFAQVGVDYKDYLRWAGEKTLADFARNNPAWTQRAWSGLVLESRDTILAMRDWR